MPEAIIPEQHIYYPVWQIVGYKGNAEVYHELIMCLDVKAKKEVSARFEEQYDLNKMCLFLVPPTLQTKLIKTCERTVSEKVEQ